MEPELWTVFVAALVTALATGLGVLPFVFCRRMRRQWLGRADAAAAGFMAAASALLLWEGAHFSVGRTALGAIAGALAIAVARKAVGNSRNAHLGALRGADATKAISIVGVMTAHSFSEGVGLGVSYGGGATLGVVITLAIAVHNIPEGLAISLVLVPRGASRLTAAGWSIFSSLPQPLMAIPAFLFVEAFAPVLPVGLGFAAGAMLWLVFRELVPDARRNAPGRAVAISAGFALAAMTALQIALLLA